MPDYIVQPGDCFSSIAFGAGFFWQNLWNLPENANLRTFRKDPNVLFPGDSVFIPDRRMKVEPGATGSRHRFKLKGVPEKLNIHFLREGKPRKNIPYVLDVDGRVTNGRTDGAGWVHATIPPDARRCLLKLAPEGKPVEEYAMGIGHLDPVDEVSGYQARLQNLGYFVGEVDGKPGPETTAALQSFQLRNGFEVTGQPDSATLEAVKKKHGS